MIRIDLNADAGESFGAWNVGHDDRLMPLLSSVNLACGFHAGDAGTMQRSVALAAEHGVAIGAHPGFPDLLGFGRRELAASPDEVYADTLYQLGALSAFLRPHQKRLHHVKPHGALYLKMLVHTPTAAAVAAAVKDFDTTLPLVVLAGLGGEQVAEIVREAGLRAVLEAFPDRGYGDDGRLASRAEPGAVVYDPLEVARRALLMAQSGVVTSLSGKQLEITAETLCLHGDAPNAPATARAVRSALAEAEIGVQTF